MNYVLNMNLSDLLHQFDIACKQSETRLENFFLKMVQGRSKAVVAVVKPSRINLPRVSPNSSMFCAMFYTFCSSECYIIHITYVSSVFCTAILDTVLWPGVISGLSSGVANTGWAARRSTISERTTTRRLSSRVLSRRPWCWRFVTDSHQSLRHMWRHCGGVCSTRCKLPLR